MRYFCPNCGKDNTQLIGTTDREGNWTEFLKCYNCKCGWFIWQMVYFGKTREQFFKEV